MKILILLLFFLGELSGAQEKYGLFDNSDLRSTEIEKIKKAGVAIINHDKIFSDKLFKFGEQFRFCSRENFTEQRLWSTCSGTLIAPDIVLTAGHCVLTEAHCKTLSFAFDYLADADIERIQRDSQQIYKCKKLLYTSKPIPASQLKDYALIQLDRKVIGREPLTLSSAKLEHPTEVFSVGHPLGLPLKISKGFTDAQDSADNQKNQNLDYYKAKLITHFGLSGGGVYNSNFELIGVLVRGDASMQADDGRCQRTRNCDSDDCPWAHIQKIELTKIKKFLK